MNYLRRLAFVTSVSLCSIPSLARADRGFGYAWADQPAAASYQPDRARSFSTAYLRPEITRSGTGIYSVRFPGLGSGGDIGGHVQVTAYGTTNRYCKVTSWGASGADFTAGVRCYSGATLADTTFTVLATWPEENDNKLGYAWADQQSAASYTPSVPYSFNASGQGVSITRTSTGRYAVRFIGLSAGAGFGGNVQVTSYGGTSERCHVTSWASGGLDFTANVACFTSAGVAVDTRYNVMVRASADAASRYSHVWADQPTSASYTPSANYARNASGGSMVVTRSGVGNYSVRFTALADAARPSDHAQVTAYSSAAVNCVVSSWTVTGTNLNVPVRCFNANGAADSTFSLLVTGRRHYVGEPMMNAIAKLEHYSDRKPRLRTLNGAVRFLSASIPTIGGGDNVDRALSFLTEFRELYGLNDPMKDLYLRRYSSDDHLFFGMRNGEVPVHGAELGVHLDQSGVTATNGTYYRGAQEDPEPEVSLVAAEQAAIAHGDFVEHSVTGATLPLYVEESGFTSSEEKLRPAWQVTLHGARSTNFEPATIVYIVDGVNGQILRAAPGRRDTAAVKDFEIWSAGGATYNWNTCRYSSRTLLFDEAGPLPAYVPTDVDVENAFDFSHQTYDQYFTRFHRHGFDDADSLMQTNTHDSSAAGNAWFDPPCGFLVFGEGMASNDVFAHEVTHMISNDILEYLNETGALNESYSDIFGTMIDSDWTIGEDTAAGTFRSMSHPPLYGHPDHYADRYTGGADFGGVHTNSGIHNKVAYLLADGDTHNGIVVLPIFRTKMYQLFFTTLTTRLSEASGFQDARDMTVETAESFVRDGLHAFTPSNVCSVMEAFASVGLGERCDVDEPAGEGDYVPSAFDNCPLIRNPDQRDTDHDGVGDACDGDDDNDGICDIGGPLPAGSGVPAGGCTAGPSGRDNCQFAANPGQEDPDMDGRGDHCDDDDGDRIVNVHDNCPTIANSDQRDLDGDDVGDVCDSDDDADGVLDGSDNCPRGNGDDDFEVPTDTNASQTDNDADGLGNLCDNCVDVFDPTGADSDEDGPGDACDPDDDNDGICDWGGPIEDTVDGVPPGGCDTGPGGSDNCQWLANPDQIDIDDNGLGLLCDENEEMILSGDYAGWLDGWAAIIEEVMRFPIFPCIADGCPDWLDKDFKTVVQVVLPQGFEARITDDMGIQRATGKWSPNGTILSFRPKADAYYEFGQGDSMIRSRYFLEVIAPENFPLGTSIPIGLGSHNLP